MGDQRGSGISWTDETWNPIRGCSRVSEGCRACYAEKIAARFSGPGQPFHGLAVLDDRGARWTGEVRLVPEHLEDPLRWRRPRRVFVNSMSDLFHEKLSVETIARVFAVMALAPRHTFQVLTKRASRMLDLMQDEVFLSEVFWQSDKLINEADFKKLPVDESFFKGESMTWPLPNVWLGVSVEHQEAADERVPDLVATPAAIRWLSVEPMLGPVDLSAWVNEPNRLMSEIGWVVCGGESGQGARPMEIEWARALRIQCDAAGVPFYMKQLGGVRDACKEMAFFPADLRRREYPDVRGGAR